MTASDRRHPPQAEIMALMIELGGITQAAREELKAFREEREAWRDDIAELKAALKSNDADRKQLHEEIKPLSEALHQARAFKWVVVSIMAVVAALAAFKAQLLALAK